MTRKAKAPYQPRGKDLKQLAPHALAKGKTVKHALTVSPKQTELMGRRISVKCGHKTTQLPSEFTPR